MNIGRSLTNSHFSYLVLAREGLESWMRDLRGYMRVVPLIVGVQTLDHRYDSLRRERLAFERRTREEGKMSSFTVTLN